MRERVDRYSYQHKESYGNRVLGVVDHIVRITHRRRIFPEFVDEYGVGTHIIEGRRDGSGPVTIQTMKGKVIEVFNPKFHVHHSGTGVLEERAVKGKVPEGFKIIK